MKSREEFRKSSEPKSEERPPVLQGLPVSIEFACSEGLRAELTICSGPAADKGGALSDPKMNLIRNSMTTIKQILEEMRELASTALDRGMAREERLKRQIRLTRNQLLLHERIYGLSYGLAFPEEGTSFYDTGVREQQERISMQLEKMYAAELRGPTENPASPGQNAGPCDEFVEFRKADFELDDEGRLKMKDARFNSLSKESRASLGSFLRIFSRQGSLYPAGDISPQQQLSRISLSLLSPQASAASAMKADEQLAAFIKLEEEFAMLATTDPLVEYSYRELPTDESGLIATQCGLMLMPGVTPDAVANAAAPAAQHNDMRLLETRDPIGRFFAQLEGQLKDKTYPALGFGSSWRNEVEAKGVNEEQIMLVNEAIVAVTGEALATDDGMRQFGRS